MNTRKRKNTPRSNGRSCKTLLHEQLTRNREVIRIHSVSSRDYPSASLRSLIDANILGKKAKYVCNVCLEHGGKLLDGQHQDNVNNEMELIDITEGDVSS